MPVNDYLSVLTTWYQQTIAGSQIWPGIGFGVAVLAVLAILVSVFYRLYRLLRSLGRWVASKRKDGWQGHGIAVAPLSGPGGRAVTKALRQALEDDLDKFCFGAPFSLLRAEQPKARGRFGIRDMASQWLQRRQTDLLVWGHRPRRRRDDIQIDILSREGTLPAEDAAHSRVFLPRNFVKAPELVRRIGVYLVARALQPGLALATAYKTEKIESVAGILADALALEDTFPEQTRALMETDYCTMGLHIGSHDHLTRVVMLRRKRLAHMDDLTRTDQVAVRIDLGRALLALSEQKFDPTQLREAMDNLKLAVEQLREHPTIRVATATSQAVQKGQSMLSARKRFSVTSGSGV